MSIEPAPLAPTHTPRRGRRPRAVPDACPDHAAPVATLVDRGAWEGREVMPAKVAAFAAAVLARTGYGVQTRDGLLVLAGLRGPEVMRAVKLRFVERPLVAWQVRGGEDGAPGPALPAGSSCWVVAMYCGGAVPRGAVRVLEE